MAMVTFARTLRLVQVRILNSNKHNWANNLLNQCSNLTEEWNFFIDGIYINLMICEMVMLLICTQHTRNRVQT